MANGRHLLIVNKGTVKDILALLMWVSQDTLDKDKLMTEDELLETARSIMDRLRVDYTTRAGY